MSEPVKKIIKDVLNEMETIESHLEESGFRIGGHTYHSLRIGGKNVHFGEDGLLLDMNTNPTWPELLNVITLAKEQGFV